MHSISILRVHTFQKTPQNSLIHFVVMGGERRWLGVRAAQCGFSKDPLGGCVAQEASRGSFESQLIPSVYGPLTIYQNPQVLWEALPDLPG